MHVETLRWIDAKPGYVTMVEQTLLPGKHCQLEVHTVEQMVDAIRRLAVRGAPAIGVAAAYGVVLGVQALQQNTAQSVLQAALQAAQALALSRPTAVNLFWALRRMRARAESEFARDTDAQALIEALLEEAHAIYHSDQQTCRTMGELGAELVRDQATILTHCNAGALATAGMGTALAPIYCAVESGKRVRVYADETRPLLQGARLTAWELQQAGIEVTLITDGMAARVMYEGKIDAVFVGSDRIARNGDVCNKIGTYGVALAAKAHNIPFYVVAPLSTFDPELADGRQIPIEERAGEEITSAWGRQTAPEGVRTYNPAFDVTPAALVSAIVTEVGILHSPNQQVVLAALRRGGRLGE